MVADAIRILEAYRVMTVATLRPDGWPQATLVGYANEELDLYFLVARTSQKLANIHFDDRIAVAIGEEPLDGHHIRAVYAAANAVELEDPGQRAYGWELLRRRHPNLADYDLPDATEAAMIRARCHHVSALDFTVGESVNWPSTMARSPGATWSETEPKTVGS